VGLIVAKEAEVFVIIVVVVVVVGEAADGKME
jgi:hypothetical protein